MWGDNKRSYFKYINDNRQYRTIIDPFQDEDDHLMHRGGDKAEVFNSFFASVFNRPRGSQYTDLEDHDCENDQNPKIVRDLLLQLDPRKSTGPVGIHPRILKMLAVGIAKPLFMIF
ncbi:hypothetical protein WISP_113869 [Willisornis vidua]|uniref:Uncharacterized protein n=1 Tax=Willisornis vidua TaxID=1566151 RepID=A0ABQ9CUR2_9PASS|nr:hypothetical protein WISP_113869 [Willisornis vidua]